MKGDSEQLAVTYCPLITAYGSLSPKKYIMSSTTPPIPPPHIGTLAEKSLHAALKEWLARPGDRQEVRVDGFVIDIVRGEALIEIQTRHFGAMKQKLQTLLPHHPIHLVHPIAREKWIVRQTADGRFLGRRKSPKKGRLLDVFAEMVRIPHLLPHPNLTVMVLLTQQEEIWRDDGRGSWRRRRWSVHDHRLLDVVAQHTFNAPADWLALLPDDLPHPFSNRDLEMAVPCRLSLAQKITYTLRHADLLAPAGKLGNAWLFARQGSGTG